MRRCFVMAPSAHKAELIGLHLIQASRDTVTVRGWHSGSEHFVELQEVPTMAASHKGSFGKAHRELVVLVLKVELWSLRCTSLREAETDWLRMENSAIQLSRMWSIAWVCVCFSHTDFTARFVCCIHNLTHAFY